MARNNPPAQGVLELHSKGHGFLRNPARNYAPQHDDAFVPGMLLQKHKLRQGLLLGVGTGNSVNAPEGVTRPILFA